VLSVVSNIFYAAFVFNIPEPSILVQETEEEEEKWWNERTGESERKE
jgi:hypothetical protein